jgi:hypothetical protein
MTHSLSHTKERTIMGTFIKLFIIAAVCYGVWCCLGFYFPKSHQFAFGLGGMGFTYLVLGTAAAGLITAKVVKD